MARNGIIISMNIKPYLCATCGAMVIFGITSLNEIYPFICNKCKDYRFDDVNDIRYDYKYSNLTTFVSAGLSGTSFVFTK
jgi:hypothetical protein